MIDLHIHSKISHDGENSILEYCQKAQQIGLKEIGFCEHLDLFPLDPHFDQHNYEQYLNEIQTARKEFPQLNIRMGVEVTYLPAIKKDIQKFLEDKEYDFVLGAIHLVEDGSFTVSEPEPARDYFSFKDPKACYEHYFELVLDAVKSGLFDGIAHLDLINRYGLNYFPDWEWRLFYGLLRRIFEGMMKRQMVLEVNTGGWRQLPSRPYPEPEVLKLYRELGGELITIGSDAHSLKELGFGFKKAIAILCELGFQSLASFEKRFPISIPIKSNNSPKTFMQRR